MTRELSDRKAFLLPRSCSAAAGQHDARSGTLTHSRTMTPHESAARIYLDRDKRSSSPSSGHSQIKTRTSHAVRFSAVSVGWTAAAQKRPFSRFGTKHSKWRRPRFFEPESPNLLLKKLALSCKHCQSPRGLMRVRSSRRPEIEQALALPGLVRAGHDWSRAA